MSAIRTQPVPAKPDSKNSPTNCKICEASKLSRDDFIVPAGSLARGTITKRIQQKMVTKSIDLMRNVGRGLKPEDPEVDEFDELDGLITGHRSSMTFPISVNIPEDLLVTSCSFCHTLAEVFVAHEKSFELSCIWEMDWKPTKSDNEHDKSNALSLPTQRHLRVMQRGATMDQGAKKTNIIIVPYVNDATTTSNREDGLLNPAQIRHWLDCCQTWHGHTCEDLMSSSKETFSYHLIDVLEGCLVSMQSACRYIALSYIWGRCNTLLTLRENISAFMQKGSLSENTAGMPKSIGDAILLTRLLGERYLWVDSLCIVQDDDESKMIALSKMDRIYNRALVTVVAGGGNDANAGLPGVRPFSRTNPSTRVQVNSELQVEIVGHGPIKLRDSIYSTRAWTYQEATLSRRKIVFVDGYIYFQCRTTSWFEEIKLHDPNNLRRPPPIYGFPNTWRDRNETRVPSMFRLLINNTAHTRSFYVFVQTARILSTKQLTMTSDILNAFDGFASVLGEDLNSTFFWGIPTINFDLFLLWNPASSNLPRREGFPSWSWAGWVGEISWDDMTDDGEAFIIEAFNDDGIKAMHDECWMVWTKFENGVAKAVFDPARRPHPGKRHSHKKPGFASRASNWPARKLFHRDTLGERIQRDPSLEAMNVVASCANSTHLLHFWTYAASFYLSKCGGDAPIADERNQDILNTVENTEEQLSDSPWVYIKDKFNRECGALLMTAVSEWTVERLPGNTMPGASTMPTHELLFLKGSDIGTDSNNGRDSFMPNSEMYGLERSPKLENVLRTLASEKQTSGGIYVVMLVEWREGIAYRAGLGKVYKSAVEHAVIPGKWKEILLG